MEKINIITIKKVNECHLKYCDKGGEEGGEELEFQINWKNNF